MNQLTITYGNQPIIETPSGICSYTLQTSNKFMTNDITVTARFSMTDTATALINRTITSYENDSLETVEYYAFAGCESLSHVNLPNVTSLSTGAFAWCTSLQDIILSSGITKLPNQVFYRCSVLGSISFPNVTSIGASAFAGCYISSINFPNVLTIGSYAFHSCTGLNSINLPNVSTIGSGAFYQCINLVSVNIPNALTLESYAFMNCSKLTSISLPQVTSIQDQVFMSCAKLSFISSPNVTTIGSYAFGACFALTSISLPNITTIDSYAFRSCSALTSIYILTSTVPSLGGSTVFYATPIFSSTYTGSFGSIYVLSSMVSVFKAATNWSRISARITSYSN